MNDNYNGPETIYAGMFAPLGEFGEPRILTEDWAVPLPDLQQNFVLDLHASGGGNMTAGRQYISDVSGTLSHSTYNTWRFSAIRGSAINGQPVLMLRPTDNFDRYPSNVAREGYWNGLLGAGPDPSRVYLITTRRVDALMDWATVNLPIHPTKRSMIGGSMGAWGCMTYGIRRPHMFAALYPDRPRVRYNNNYDSKLVTIPNWTSGSQGYTAANSPLLADRDGGQSVFDYHDAIAYVSNPNNDIPWIGWCIGVADGFSDFRDHIDLVNAMRASKRAFAFAWNGGNHSTGSIISTIRNSYPFGTFELGKGYPLFTNHSGDDPLVAPTIGDLTTRGINIGLSFRNVIETPTSWSCEVTSILGPRTVTVEPISKIFNRSVTPINISIPSANTWVAVSFN